MGTDSRFENRDSNKRPSDHRPYVILSVHLIIEYQRLNFPFIR